MLLLAGQALAASKHDASKKFVSALETARTTSSFSTNRLIGTNLFDFWTILFKSKYQSNFYLTYLNFMISERCQHKLTHDAANRGYEVRTLRWSPRSTVFLDAPQLAAAVTTCGVFEMTSFADETLTTVDEGFALVDQSTQEYQGHQSRSGKALAALIWHLYITIQKLLSSLSPHDLAQMLMARGITPASNGTSEFTPFIHLICGEWETRTDKKGSEKKVWVKNRSFEVYHHAMEELAASNVTTGGEEWLLDRGGAAAVSTARKKRLAEAALPDKQAEEEALRSTLLEHGSLSVVTDQVVADVASIVADGAFFSAVFHKGPDGLVLVGLDREDARGAATALARKKESELREAKIRAEERAQASRDIQAQLTAEGKMIVDITDKEQLRKLLQHAHD